MLDKVVPHRFQEKSLKKKPQYIIKKITTFKLNNELLTLFFFLNEVFFCWVFLQS